LRLFGGWFSGELRAFARVCNIINQKYLFVFHNRGNTLRQNWLVSGFGNAQVKLNSDNCKIGNLKKVRRLWRKSILPV
jgi:hypothetical protein